MKYLFYGLKKLTFRIKSNIQFFFLLISLFCICFLYLKLISIDAILRLTSISIIFQFLILLCSIFTILFLPSYPIFFSLLKDKKFNFKEKISITVVSNLSFYILIGFIGSYLNVPITFNYFLFLLTLSYFSIILVLTFQRIRQRVRGQQDSVQGFENKLKINKEFSIFNSIKKSFSLTAVLLIIFVILICVLNIIITPFFAGTDPWVHISIIKYITENHVVPYDEYYGALGLHIFGAVIHFFTGINLIMLPKYFILYTLPLSSLIVYNLLLRIFKNRNLAIFGVYLLAFSSLGFIYMNTQFWPSGIVLIQGLFIFFFIYVRLQNLINEKIPKKKEALSNILFSYILLTLVFISSILTHSLIAMVFIFSYLWIYAIYFVNNYKRGFDFLLLILFLSIFIIFYFLNISTGHFKVFIPGNILPWYSFFIGIVVFTVFELIILKHYRKSLDFTKGRFKLIIIGKKNSIYKKIEEKYLIPVILSIIIILSSFFAIGNLLIFNFDILSIFNTFDIIVLCLMSFWGLILYQYKPKGKPLFFWFLAQGIILLLFFLFDVLIKVTGYYSRIFYIASTVISIGIVAYLYKSIKMNTIQHRNFKIFFLLVMIFSLIISFFQNSVTIENFSLKNQEVNSVQWYSNYTYNKQVIISEFGWGPIFMFYDYPFENKNDELPFREIHYFLLVENQYVHPSLHHSEGRNILKELKSSYNTEVVLILPKKYYLEFSWQFFDQLSEEEIEAYYTLEYLNRIFSARGEDGEDTPYYWVI